MQLADREKLVRDGFVGLWLILTGYTGHAIYQGWVPALPSLGILPLTAVASYVAYRRGKAFGSVDLP